MGGRRFWGCGQPGAPGSLPRLCPGGRRGHLINTDSVLPRGTAYQRRGRAGAKVVDGTAGFRGNDITLYTDSDAISAKTGAENSHCFLVHTNLLNTLQAVLTVSSPPAGSRDL